ncbi:hypothetical protein SS50377_21411 [Spironucleus salmonicida]|uniref:Transmembrane protein n=1 Tax=Spironucleus salmonicida TaxID=348837 RepID=A0A9P8S0C1_9EUKA|nr:hypothetical protein SS50377_21411 [Spironucleus salmonicida]
MAIMQYISLTSIISQISGCNHRLKLVNFQNVTVHQGRSKKVYFQKNITRNSLTGAWLCSATLEFETLMRAHGINGRYKYKMGCQSCFVRRVFIVKVKQPLHRKESNYCQHIVIHQLQMEIVQTIIQNWILFIFILYIIQQYTVNNRMHQINKQLLVNQSEIYYTLGINNMHNTLHQIICSLQCLQNIGLYQFYDSYQQEYSCQLIRLAQFLVA